MATALVLTLLGLTALAVGVLIGRYYVPDDRNLRRSASHGRSYLRALSHVLARDPEAALVELRGVVEEENIEDPEPYFAMAALFRSRGEHERAIRVHQALAQRERDRKRLRLRSLYELGLDFRAAGMPRRATRAMEEVLADDPVHEGGLRALSALYEEQGRWGEAAAICRRLSKLLGEPVSRREHHLRVAAGQAAMHRGDLESAKHWLKEARNGPDGESPHFLVASAELAAAAGNSRGARDRLRQAVRAEPALATHLWRPLWDAERLLAQDRLEQRDLDSDPLDDDLATDAAADAAADAADDAAGDAADDGAGRLSISSAADPGAAAALALAMPSGPAIGQDPVAIITGSHGPSGTDASAGAVSVARPAAGGIAGLASRSPEAVGRARTDALLRAIAVERGPRIEIALARSELAGVEPSQGPVDLRPMIAAFPGSVAARLASARLALQRGTAREIAAALEDLTSAAGPLAWAIDGRWRCSACAKTFSTFLWRCVECRRWATLALQTGVEAAPVLAARERRSERRRIDGSAQLTQPELAETSSQLAGTLALPPPATDGGISDRDLAVRETPRSPLRRAGAWISGVWSGTRGTSTR
jgi:lipopolysaccharide biosynthesis regulator YciM